MEEGTMPNQRIMEAMAERRRQMRPEAERIHQQYAAEVPQLIRQLAGPTQEEYDRAFDLLSRMSDTIVDELLAALVDPELDPFAAEEVVSLLGLAGDERAREPIWHFFQAHLDDPMRASIAALSLAGLGDERVLPYLRQSLKSEEREVVANAVAGMLMLGETEDIPRLREAHHWHRGDREIRMGIANAILTILGETDQHTFNRTMDEIQYSFADYPLWEDMWTILESQFGERPTVH